MEHYSVFKNYRIDTISLCDLSVAFLKKFNGNILYVYDNEKLIGIVGKKELNKSIDIEEIIINSNYKYVNADDESAIRLLFGDEPHFSRIPFVKNNKVEYEFCWSRDAYYRDVVIDKGVNTEQRDERIIVSLTSHGKRLKWVYIAIKSIMKQTMKADEIVLYLDESSNEIAIDHEEELSMAGLRIVRGKENLRCHCKYYYAMEDYEDAIVITVDDDIIYPDNLIEDLYSAHVRYPDAIIAHRAHRAIDENGKELRVADYKWEQYSEKPEKFFCATGVGGILYPKGNYRKAFLDRQAIKECALNSDDIWLMYIEAMQKKKVYALPAYKLREIEHSQEEEGLTIKNDVYGENQIWLENLEKYHGEKLEALVSEAW